MMIEIQLTRGLKAIIDECDADLCGFLWHARSASSGTEIRPARASKKGEIGRNVYLHKVIFERMIGRKLLKGEMVDHKDCNPLNNSRSNLRLATYVQNNTNRRGTAKSGYKGVYQKGKSWYAIIKVNKKRIRLGTHSTPEKAYAAYCEAAKKYHGEFANLDIKTNSSHNLTSFLLDDFI